MAEREVSAESWAVIGIESVVGVVGEELAIDGEDGGLADEADEHSVGVDNGECPGVGAVEGLDDGVHAVLGAEEGLWLCHELRYAELGEQFGTKDEMAYVVEVHDADELHLAVDDGEDVVLAGGYLAGYVAECHVGVEDFVVVLYDAVYVDEGEDAAVGVVGEELSALCEAHGVDAVGFEDLDGEVCADGDHHEGQEEVVASGELGDEEDAGEGGVHDSAHESAHAEHGEVVLADLDAEDVVGVPQSCEDEACDAAEEQGGGEDSAASAAAVGGRGGEDLGEDDECQVYEEETCVSCKEGAVHGCVPVGGALAVHEEFDEFVSFAVE